jgi:hypothetical protein
MVALLGLFLHVLASPLKTRARLEAEIVFLRHQLNVLRRGAPHRPRLTVVDRLIFVLAVSLRAAAAESHRHHPTRDDCPMASGWL